MCKKCLHFPFIYLITKQNHWYNVKYILVKYLGSMAPRKLAICPCPSSYTRPISLDKENYTRKYGKFSLFQMEHTFMQSKIVKKYQCNKLTCKKRALIRETM